MNERVREYLIEVATKKDKFVYYSDVVEHCELEINIGTDYGRKQLSDILGKISEYEDSEPNNRPLLSSLVIYKNQSKNDHGDGFYKMAEQLDKGSFKKLKDDLYGFTEAERCRVFWQNEENYKKFASVTQSKERTISDLFADMVHNENYQWANGWKNVYLNFTNDIKLLRESLLNNPTAQISDDNLFLNLSDSVNSYENFMMHWLQKKDNGISSRGRSVLSFNHFNEIINDDLFKIIVKAVIIDPSLENYNAFTSWWYSNENINNHPLLINRAFAACNPELLSSTVDNRKFWEVARILQDSFNFKFESEHSSNWFDANSQITAWLSIKLSEVLNYKTTDKLEQDIWRNIFVWLIYEEFSDQNIVPNSLIKTEKPTNGFEELPEKKREFKGVSVDYETRAKDQKDLGDAGEELVKQYEIKYLEEQGMYKQASAVKIVKDGEGYDVLSFDELGNKKYIEVKTTTGKDLTPFYLSANEVAFMRVNIHNYKIYRVFNYDEENNSGQFFEIAGEVESQLLMKPTQYQVVIKKEINT